MKVLLACEESQAVAREFRALGHEAYSCDVLPTSGKNPEWHIQGDVINHLNDGWDMIIGFPPCTYMTNGGGGRMNRAHYKNKKFAGGSIARSKTFSGIAKAMALQWAT